MSQITNDEEFRQALHGLDAVQQRVVAAGFVEHVLSLSTDDRIASVVKVAADSGASDDDVANALKSAKSAAIDSHTRCGSEGDWTEQAGYFVARAAVAAVTPLAQSKGGSPAWQAAMSCRMAKTSILIDNEADEAPTHNESEWQYSMLPDYLNS